MSEILNKIGIIENPFSKDVNCAYARTTIEEIEKRKGKEGLYLLFDRLFQDHLNIDWERNRIEKYLRDEHSWIDAFLSKAIIEIGKELIGDDKFYYFIGNNSLRPGYLQISVVKFFSTKGIFKIIEYANRVFNNVIELKVYGKTERRNSIRLRKQSLENYKKRILERMGDENLLKQWMKDDCDMTIGILEAIPTLYKKVPAKLVQQTECEGWGDPFCTYYFEWESEKAHERFWVFFKKIFTIDYHWEMKKVIRQMEATVQNRTEELSKANFNLEKTNNDLRDTQSKLLEAEKRTLEHRITGGFAHEMRNALSGAQLEFKTILNYKNKGKPSAQILKESATSLLKNITLIHERYDIPREEIATDFVPELKTIAEIADHLSGVHSGVSSDLDRGLSITTQIRDYAKMSEMKPGDTPVDIVALLKEYTDRYRQDFESIGIRYAVEGIDKAVVKADEIHLNSIFSNLILNARDALEECKTERQKEIKVTIDSKNDDNGSFFIIKVSDNGLGIPENNLNQIFEPFFSTKPTSGTGLGLGIVKRLVQLYGGEIEVESMEGEGAIFIVMLPGDILATPVPSAGATGQADTHRHTQTFLPSDSLGKNGVIAGQEWRGLNTTTNYP